MNLPSAIAELTELYKAHGALRLFASDIVPGSLDLIREISLDELDGERIVKLEF